MTNLLPTHASPLSTPPEVSDVAIRVSNLSKCYQIYNQPQDRLKQSIYPRLQRLIGKPSKIYHREFWALKNVSFEPGLFIKKDAVIPAKAGIQLINKSTRKWDNIIGFVCFADRIDRWIPAFAGMTAIWVEEKKGENVGIIGRNGSGKSTPLQMISGKIYTWFCFAWIQKTRKGFANVL